MTEETILTLLHRGTSLAMEVPASTDDRIAWVGVYPLHRGSPEGTELRRRHGISADESDHVYHVRRFEMSRALSKMDVWFSENDLENKQQAVVVGDGDLRRKLLEFGAQLDQLQQHFQTDYPI